MNFPPRLSFCQKSLAFFSLALAVVLNHSGISQAAKPGAAPLPVVGQTSPENRWLPHQELVYTNDFETPSRLFDLGGLGASYTTQANQVIQGNRSIRLAASALFEIPANLLNLKPNEIYTIEFHYVLDNPSATGGGIFTGFRWTGFDPGIEKAASTPIPGLSPKSGVFRHNMRLPNQSKDFRAKFGTYNGGAVIDNIKIYRMAPKVLPAAPNLLKFGFPRLSNFHVYSTYAGSDIYDVPVETVRKSLARFDLANGVDLDFTLGAGLDHAPLRSINPDMLLLPYWQTFVSVFPSRNKPPANSAGLLQLFNSGLAPEWFATNPEGKLLFELLYPENLQMNHTFYCPVIGNETFMEYLRRFMTRTVLPSGYWDGIHFDQAEWFPNPLLGNIAPYLEQSEIFVPIDFDYNGTADTLKHTHDLWYSAFIEHFTELDRQIGSSSLFFGNPGEMTHNETIMSLLNGVQNEFWRPYRMKADGSFDNDDASYWYRSLDIALKSRAYLRAPQIPSTQMTGFRLGEPSGNTSTNGLPERKPVMTLADERRLRFGLTSVLLADGFFGYDFTDNSSPPLAWGDEFAVNLTTGRSSELVAHTHYLGQPLGDPVELDYPKILRYQNDFETTPLPNTLGVVLGSDLKVTKKPNEVLSGNGSAILTHFHNEGLARDVSSFLFTDPATFRLAQGKTFQLVYDYKIVNYGPEAFGVFISSGIGDFAKQDDMDIYSAAYIASKDVVTGQTGTLHASSRMKSNNYSAFITLNDTGTVIIDNVRIYEGSGGVFRRDFENGIVLVNPTPVSQTVSLERIRGPLQRTGIKRIRGNYDPTWNNGSAVNGNLVIPSLEGIILLADRRGAPAPGRPASLTATAAAGEVTLRWPKPTGTISGYSIQYGLAGGDASLYKMVGQRQDIAIKDLMPGRTYQFQISSYDYLGRLSAASPVATATIPGKTTGVVPRIVKPTAVMRPGVVYTLQGEQLVASSGTYTLANSPLSHAGTQVFANGIACRVLVLSPSSITFIAPESLGGARAVLRVVRNGNSSQSFYANLAP